MSTSENIKRIRKERGLTQKQLAKMLNVSEPMISQYESKNSNLRLSTIRNISEALDVSISDIVDDWKYDLKKDPLVNELLNLFYCLNDNGKKKVIEHAEILTKVNEYKE